MCVFVLKCPLKCEQAKYEVKMKMRGKRNRIENDDDNNGIHMHIHTHGKKKRTRSNNHIKYGSNEAIEDEASRFFCRLG